LGNRFILVLGEPLGQLVPRDSPWHGAVVRTAVGRLLLAPLVGVVGSGNAVFNRPDASAG
jgi:hypothetical protein